ncbi:hypothetical protein D3C76_1763670 [compost metagenome]
MCQQTGIYRLGGEGQLVSICDYLQVIAFQADVDLVGNGAFIRCQTGAEITDFKQVETKQLRPPGLQLPL